MERLRKIAYIFTLCSSVCGLTGVMDAQGVCSLTVRVLSPDYHPVHAAVSLQEQDGRTIDKDYTGKDLEFCDLGLLPVSITVSRRPGCNDVKVQEVQVSLDHTYHLKIIFDPNNCTPETVPPPQPSCDILIRLQDRDGVYVPNGSISLLSPHAYKSQTDRFGRLLVSERVGVRVSGKAIASGFLDKDFDFACTGYDPQETIVHLEKTH